MWSNMEPSYYDSLYYEHVSAVDYHEEEEDDDFEPEEDEVDEDEGVEYSMESLGLSYKD